MAAEQSAKHQRLQFDTKFDETLAEVREERRRADDRAISARRWMVALFHSPH